MHNAVNVFLSDARDVTTVAIARLSMQMNADDKQLLIWCGCVCVFNEPNFNYAK